MTGHDVTPGAEKDAPHRLVRVEHDRCQEIDYEARTYVLAPAEWGATEIDRRVEAAHAAYLADFSKARDLPDEPKRPPYRPDFDGCDQSLSVAEVKAQHAAEKLAHSEWEKARGPLMQPFEDYLARQGFVEIWGDATYLTTVYWGHAHGSRYEYGTTDLGKDLPSPVELGAAPFRPVSPLTEQEARAMALQGVVETAQGIKFALREIQAGRFMVAAETLVLAQAGLVVTEAAIQKIRTPEAIVAARVEAALARVEQRLTRLGHRRVEHPGHDGGMCYVCGFDWPCAVRAAIREGRGDDQHL